MIDKGWEVPVARLNLPLSLEEEHVLSRGSASALYLSRTSAISKSLCATPTLNIELYGQDETDLR
jgi:hypothetical protein